VAGYLDAGDEVAFITLGDPLTYSTFSALADAVLDRRPGTTVDVVPGIMAFQSLAARTRTTLVDERQRLSVRTAVGEGDVVADLAGDLHDPTCTVVVYKGGRHLPQLAEVARTTGRVAGAVAGELLGMSGERLGDLSTLATGPAGYLATVILPATEGAVPPARSDQQTDRATDGGSDPSGPATPLISGIAMSAPTDPVPQGDVQITTSNGQPAIDPGSGAGVAAPTGSDAPNGAPA